MSDYNFLMETRLAPEFFQTLSQISRAASEEGLNLYLVGGAVRDLTYGQQTIRDLDFAVEGSPEKILRRLAASSARAAGPEPSAAAEIEQTQFDRKLNSTELVFSNGVRVEISMSRQEVYPKPGRRPEISSAFIFEDLRRRDFSSNAMAVSLHPNSRGLLLDPTNGAADIEKHELRVLHSRSLSEDPSRIYRLLRLSVRLGFKPEERTQGYLDAALENRLWQRLDPEQQGRELRAILCEEDPGRALKALADRGLLAGLDKKLNARKIPYPLFKKIRGVAYSVPGADPFLLNFHSLVAKFGGGQRARLAKKIIGDRKAVKTALGLEHAARKLARLLSGRHASLPSQAYKILEGQPRTLLLFLLAHFPQAKIQNRIKNFLNKAPVVLSSMPRAEMLAMGAKPGPKFEKMLERLFFEQLDGKIKTHQQLLKEFRKLAGIPEPKPPAPPKPVKKVRAEKTAKLVAALVAAAPTEKPKAAIPSKPARTAKPARKARTVKPPKRAKSGRPKKASKKKAARRKPRRR